MKTAVILFNLGGPDSLEAVQPFLFNLFSDRAIINLPNPLRWMIAKLISTRRTPTAKEIYKQMGGKSPILKETEAQQKTLQATLGYDYKVFIAMRYYHPFTEKTVAEVKAYNPDKIVLLPLYPQYSTTTTGSSAKRWHEEAKKQGLEKPTHLVCCYPTNADFISAHAEKIKPYYEKATKHGSPRILFSAHGLPEKVINAGDPYQWQIEGTTRAVVEKLTPLVIPDLIGDPSKKDLDYTICYQSRVGPMKWIGPATDDTIKQTAREGRPMVVVPIAFVSEHSETLVELDIEYRHLAGGAPYFRVPAIGIGPDYINALANMVRNEQAQSVCSDAGKRLCPADRTQCPCKL